jgi:putative serine protease PepD
MAQRMKLIISSGVLIVQVQPGSAAADAGLNHGDVIHGLARSEIKTVEDLNEALKALGPGDYMLEIERSGQRLFPTITLE